MSHPEDFRQINSSNHNCECICETCQKNKTGYFALWKEECIHLTFSKMEILVHLAYFQNEQIPRTIVLTPGKVEVSISPYVPEQTK